MQQSEKIVLLVVSFLTALSIIWVRTLTVKSTYAFVKQKKKLELLETDLQLLKLKWTKATSITQLNVLAKNLGLKPLEKNQGYKVRLTGK